MQRKLKQDVKFLIHQAKDDENHERITHRPQSDGGAECKTLTHTVYSCQTHFNILKHLSFVFCTFVFKAKVKNMLERNCLFFPEKRSSLVEISEF